MLLAALLFAASYGASAEHTVATERHISPSATPSPIRQRRSVSMASTLPTHILRGHRSFVNDIAFSGTTMASAGGDSVIILWDYRTGERKQTLQGHNGYVYGVAYSPDGTLLASTGWDGMVMLWNPESGTVVRRIAAHSAPVYDIEFSPDGTQFITASWDNTAIVWDRTTGAVVHTLTGHTRYVSSATFSPDGSFIATSSADGSVKIWDAKTGQCLQTLTGNKGQHWFLTHVCFSQDGEYIAAAGAGNTHPVYVWTKKGELVQTLTPHDDYTVSVAFSRDGTRLTSASADQSLSLWNSDYFSQNERIKDHHYFLSHSFNGEGDVMAASALDGTITLWYMQTDEASPKTQKGKENKTNEVYSIQVLPNPASDFMTISYTLPSAMPCTVELVSQDAKYRTILQRGEMQPGESSLQFDSSHLPSGVYFVIVSTPSRSLSHRVELVK